MLKKFFLCACLASLSLTTAAAAFPDHPFVYIEGKAQIDLPPTVGTLEFVVTTMSAGSDNADEASVRTRDELVQLFLSHGIHEEQIETYNFEKTLSSPQNLDAEGKKICIIKRNFFVVVKDLAHWPELLGTLLHHNEVEKLSVAFDRHDKDRVSLDLLDSAALDAKQQASRMAQSFGRRLGPAVAISQERLNTIAGAFGLTGQEAHTQFDSVTTPQGIVSNTIPSHLTFSKTVHAVYKLQ